MARSQEKRGDRGEQSQSQRGSSNLNDRSLDELRQMAGDLDIEDRNRLDREALIEQIENARETDETRRGGPSDDDVRRGYEAGEGGQQKGGQQKGGQQKGGQQGGEQQGGQQKAGQKGGQQQGGQQGGQQQGGQQGGQQQGGRQGGSERQGGERGESERGRSGQQGKRQ